MSASTPLQMAIIQVTPFQQNCSLVWCTETMKGVVIDPGGDIDQVVAAIEKYGVTLERILITHAHLDHAGGASDLAERKKVDIEGPQKEDQFWIDRIEESGRNYGMTHCRKFVPSRWLEDGDTVKVGNQSLQVLHCPGHTPGHVVYFHPEMRLAFVGDVLFKGSIGRTDFPRGDHDALVKAITQKLWILGEDVQFISGHGPMSTFGVERRTNPFVGDAYL